MNSLGSSHIAKMGQRLGMTSLTYLRTNRDKEKSGFINFPIINGTNAEEEMKLVSFIRERGTKKWCLKRKIFKKALILNFLL